MEISKGNKGGNFSGLFFVVFFDSARFSPGVRSPKRSFFYAFLGIGGDRKTFFQIIVLTKDAPSLGNVLTKLTIYLKRIKKS